MLPCAYGCHSSQTTSQQSACPGPLAATGLAGSPACAARLPMPHVCSSCGCRKWWERYGCCENPKCPLVGDTDQLLDIAQSR
eukprot:2983654-Alexandrium_andersonii.AAC.1